MLDREIMRKVLADLKGGFGSDYTTEQLENVVENCKSEIGELSYKTHDEEYIDLVCMSHAFACVELSKR